MNVDDVVRERIAAARARVEAQRRRRAELDQARKAGLAQRHARKLRNLKEDPLVRLACCPACRRQSPHRTVGSVVVDGEPVMLVRCPVPVCGLIWGVPLSLQPAPVPAAA